MIEYLSSISIGHVIAACILSFVITLVLLFESLWFLTKYDGSQFQLDLVRFPRIFIVLWMGLYVAWELIGAIGSLVNSVL